MPFNGKTTSFPDMDLVTVIGFKDIAILIGFHNASEVEDCFPRQIWEFSDLLTLEEEDCL